MKKLVILFSFLFPLFIHAQTTDTGIGFEYGKSWESILAQAKATHKYVFADCYATWCGPCKFMAANVFTNDTVGQFFKEHFVCAKVQIDTATNDNEEAKSFYADASAINSKYHIKVFPTYLVFSPEGALVHRFIGSMGVTSFLRKAKESLSPSTQYYVMQKNFSKYLTDSSFLRRLTQAASDVGDDCSLYFKAYVATQSSMFTKANAELINKVTKKSKDTGFVMVLNNEAAYDKVMGNGNASSFIINMIVNEELQNIFSKDGVKTLTKSIETRLVKAYPKQAKEVIASIKVTLYTEMKDWKNYATAINRYMKGYGYKVINNSVLNEYAWNVFDHIDDKSVLQAALGWSKRSISGKDMQDAAIIDTYGNLLYKLGKVKEAIEMETKALKLAPDNDKTSYIETIAKMKKGEKTWTE